MAIHLPFLPGKSHGQKSGGLQSIGSHRVGHKWATNTHTHTHTHTHTSSIKFAVS